MSTYFLSFTSTFESLLAGRLTIADLAGGTLVFGCKLEHVLLPYDQIPIEVTLNNKIKPKHFEKANTVKRDKVDADVLTAWDAFAAQVRKASFESRLIFLRDIGHHSYEQFCQDFLRRGDRAFWKGDWVVLDEPAEAAAVQSNQTNVDEALDPAMIAAINEAEAHVDRGEPIDLAMLRAEMSKRSSSHA